MKKVSTGKSPYQITMYCANKRYTQNTENAKTILPKSCMTTGLVNRLCTPRRPRSTVAVRAIAVNALQNAPAKKYQPKSVLRHTGASDITRSNETTVYTTANKTATNGAQNLIECGGNSMSSVAIVHARASSRRETRKNANLDAVITRRPIPARTKR